MKSISAVVRPAGFSQSRHLRALALAGLAVAALSLGACGRKTGLDAPPGASSVVQGEVQQPVSSADQAASALLAPPGAGTAPVAAAGQKKRVFLDGLLD